MKVDFKKLKEFIETYAKPRWIQKEKEWYLRDGGGESYLQDILKKAAPFVKEETVSRDAKTAVLNMLKQHYNLLSAYDVMYAVTFINQVDEEPFKSHVKELLYGPDPVDTRLRETAGT